MVAHPNASRDISESTGRGRAAHPPIRAGRRSAQAAGPARTHGVRRVCAGPGAAAPAPALRGAQGLHLPRRTRTRMADGSVVQRCAFPWGTRARGMWSRILVPRLSSIFHCSRADSYRAKEIARREGNLTFHPKIPSIGCGFRKNPSLTAMGREEEGRGAGGAGWRRERSGIRRGDRASVVQNASGRALAQQGIRDEHKHDRQHEDARKHERQPPEPERVEK